MTTAEIKERMQARFPEKRMEFKEPVKGQLYAIVEKADVVDLAEFIHKELNGRFLITVATDRREDLGKFEITHVFSLDKEHLFVSIQTRVDPSDPTIPSITPKIPAAGWAEREMRDFMGVFPEGHPDPRRLVLSDDWPEGVYPLRRDVPHNYRPEPDFSAKPPLKEPPEGATVLPIGPFYLTLEEPAYFRLFVEGENIVGCDYRGFYNHRGIEKMGDSALTYNQIPFIAERICGICGYVHSCCYCQAVELAAGIEVPLRARLIRTIMLELERIHSHLLWLGLAGHIAGFDTVFMQAWRVREPVMWLCEFITGNRKHYGMNVVGGVRRDIPKEKHDKILEVMDSVEEGTKALKEAILGDTPLLMRLRDVGPLSQEEAWEVAVVGPTARGSKVDIDSRVDHPYAAYDVVPPNVIVYDTCDTLARTLVRVDEVLDSVRIVRECVRQLKGLPEGDIVAEVDEIPPGREAISVVEAPRGEDVHYVLTGGENRPYRWKVRAPSYQNIQFTPLLLRNQTIADAPIAIASTDPCFACTERVEVIDIRSGDVKVYTAEELARRRRGSDLSDMSDGSDRSDKGDGLWGR